MTDIALDTRKLDQIMAAMDFNVDQIIKWLAFQVQGKAQMKAPVDTGALRNSIRIEKVSDGVWRVLDGVEYGIFQELGFRHRGSGRFVQHPFMVPAAEEIARDMNSGRTWERLFR